MLTKLPRWVEYGALALALLAGTVNAVGLLGFQHQSVSHVSGIATSLGAELAATNSGAVVRTTHVTGVVTDLGILLGSVLRGTEFDRRKCVLLLLIITGFICGGIAGAILYAAFAFKALAAPACACFVLAGVYRLYTRSASP